MSTRTVEPPEPAPPSAHAPAPADDRRTPEALTPGAPLVFAMAVACGAAVANLYYAQPLLDTLAADFGVSNQTAGFIVTMTQLGYVAGLAFIVPLGDLLERRRLITAVSLGTVGALAGAALAPGVGVFLGAALLIGLTSVVAQVLVPFAAQLAADGQRGRVVGRVMAGLLLGILLARVVAGFLADALGWRWVFGLAALLMLVQALLLWVLLPKSRAATDLSYGALLWSVLQLLREEPVLRRRIVYGAAGFAAFNVFWTTMAFLLAGPPYGYSDTTIGLFGLVGAAGALCAVFAGQVHDRGYTRAGTGTCLALIALAFVVMGVFSEQLSALVAGVVLLDVGQQGVQILNQSVIYELRPDARSRITTAYMTLFFFGGVTGSATAAYVYEEAGWEGAALLGGAFAALAFGYWLSDR